MQHFIFIAVVSLFSYAQAQCSYTTAVGEVYASMPEYKRFEFDPADSLDTYLSDTFGGDGYLVGLISAETSDLFTPASDGEVYWNKDTYGETFQISVSNGVDYFLLTDDEDGGVQRNIYDNNWAPSDATTPVSDPTCVTAVFCNSITLADTCTGDSYTGGWIAEGSVECDEDGCDAATCCEPNMLCSNVSPSKCASGVLIADHASEYCAGADCVTTADAADLTTCCDGEAFFAGREDFSNLLPTFKKLFNAGGGC